jgi:hypothetical protein
MKKFKTSTGKSITAENIDAANVITITYNMGDIIGEEELAPRHDSGIRTGDFVAWHRIKKKPMFTGPFNSTALFIHENIDPELSLLYYGSQKCLKLTPAELLKFKKLKEMA